MNTPTHLQHLALRALLTRAKADAALTALIPVTNIDPDGEPQWPFLLIQSPTARQRRASCVRGADGSFDVHAFARARKVGETVVQTGRSHIAAIGQAIETTFADNWLVLEGGQRCKVSFSDIRILSDGDPDSWHWFGQLNFRVMAAVA